MTIRPPDSSSRLIDEGRRIDPVWERFLRQLHTAVIGAESDISTINANSAAIAQHWSWSTMIASPANGTYTYPGILANEITVLQIYVITASGTCDVVVNLAASDRNLSASSTRSSLSVNDETEDEGNIVITISNNSSASNLGVGLVGEINYIPTGGE